MLFLDWFEKDSSMLQPSIGRITAFLLVPHAGAVGSARVGVLAVCAAVEILLAMRRMYLPPALAALTWHAMPVGPEQDRWTRRRTALA